MSASSDPLLRHIRRLVAPPVPDPTTDASLLTRFISDRDEAAFATLVARHGPMVLRVCRRVLGDAHAAEDAFQAAFLVLARKAAAVQPRSALAAWMHGVAHRVASEARRARGRRLWQTQPLASPPADPHPDPLAELSARELLGLLDEEVRRLPEVYRLPVILCCLEGHTQEEVARQLGWTAGSVKGRLERGRARLHKRLVGRGLTLPMALAALEVSRSAASAGVPAGLCASTIHAGMTFASGKTLVEGMVTANARALAEETIKGIAMTKLKVLVALTLATCILVGAGVVAHQVLPDKHPKTKQSDLPEPAVQAQERPNPARDPQVRTDRLGDPLPAGAVARLGTVRLKHGSRTYGVVFSPDGKTIASGSLEFDPVVRLWDASTGLERLGIAVEDPPLRNSYPSKGIMTLAYSPDGKMLAGGCTYGLLCTLLWDSQTGQLLRSYPSRKAAITSVAFSPDGKTLAWGSYDQSLTLAEVSSGKVTRTLEGLGAVVHSVCFTPDGTTLLWAGEDKAIHFCDVMNGKELRRLVGHEKRVSCVRAAPDGRRLASGSADSTARIWDFATGKELHCCRGHARDITGLAFSSDSKQLFTGSRDQTVRIWDLATGQGLRTLPVQGIDVSAIALSPDGRRLAVSGFEQSVSVFDVASGEEALPRTGHRGWVSRAHFFPDGKTLATGSSDGTLRVWDVRTATELRTLMRDHDGWFIDFAFSPDGRTLAASAYGNELYLLESATGKVVRRLAEPEGHISQVRFLSNGKAVATYAFNGGVNRLTIWNAVTGKKLSTFQGQYLYTFAFSPDGKTAAISDKDLALWDVSTGKEIRRLPIERPESIAFTPDGKALLLALRDGPMVLWDLARSRPRRQLKLGDPGPISHANTLALSPDGRLAATIDRERGFKVWEVATLKEVSAFQGHAGTVNNLEFAPDGRTLLSSSDDGTVLIWDILGLAAASGGAKIDLEQSQLQALWTDLSSEDAAVAYRAVAAFARAPQQALPFLHERLRPAPAVAERDLARWLTELNDAKFAVRKRASEQLEKAEGAAEAILRRALAAKPSLEARQRIEYLLARIEDGEGALIRRAVAVLEYTNTKAAQRFLDTLAGGAPGAWLTQEAKAALERLAKRATQP